MDDPVLQVSNQEPSMSSKYPNSWPPILDTLIIKISTRNFQGIFLRVKQHHPWHQGWPCPWSLRSGTLNVFQVPSFLTPIPDTFLIKISTQNFQGIFLGVKQHHPWHQWWPCPPSLRSGTLNILQVPPFLTPHRAAHCTLPQGNWLYLLRGVGIGWVSNESGKIRSNLIFLQWKIIFVKLNLC